jgi:signal transduction histidine kinase
MKRLFTDRSPVALALLVGGSIALVFVILVLRYDYDLRRIIRDKMVQRDAAVLTAVAQQEIETGVLEKGGSDPTRWLSALLPAAHRDGVLAIAIFDADGVLLEKIPTNQLLVDLPPEDFVRLQDGRPVTRYWPGYSLATLLAGGPAHPTPLVEIVVPLRTRRPLPGSPLGADVVGFVRYDLDGRGLAGELAALDSGVRRQTIVTLAVGIGALGLVVAAGYMLLARAQRTIAERTARLQRANFELTLAAKTSALGQLTSHLIHGLQGSVAGLRAVVSSPSAEAAPDWATVAGYADRMQVMIQEIVGLLGDRAAATSYDLTGLELADTIRRRNEPVAANKGVILRVNEGFTDAVDSHRGGVLCLIASNLVQNAIDATAGGDKVTVSLRRDAEQISLVVADTGPGIPTEVREHLFEPGYTGRAGGSGLGLAISHLLATQIGACLALDASGPEGTVFRVTLPL